MTSHLRTRACPYLIHIELEVERDFHALPQCHAISYFHHWSEGQCLQAFVCATCDSLLWGCTLTREASAVSQKWEVTVGVFTVDEDNEVVIIFTVDEGTQFVPQWGTNTGRCYQLHHKSGPAEVEIYHMQFYLWCTGWASNRSSCQ